ncbi:MAG: excinuclease ABC subunit UvrC [Planctomycetota bacterium]|nr:excinuclease ABC subunit UvrC [Planctomycetota bacterium]
MSQLAWNPDIDLGSIPEQPGVYLFRDVSGAVLYVGKSARLRDRVRTYRSGGDGRWQIRFLDAEARTVETIVTRTEQEALLLEDTLIKTHKPPHNVRLKDDKSFRMLRIDLSDAFPRLKFVRAKNPDVGREGGRARFFGPFASSGALRKTLSDLHRIVPLRDCPDHVLNNRSRPCLKHQIGLCSAPCVGLISAGEYAALVDKAARILSGDVEDVRADLEARMRSAADALEYERAAGWRDRLTALSRTVEGQGVRPKDDVRRDVLGLARAGDAAVVHRLSFGEGRMHESRAHVFRSQLPDEELLHVVLTALYAPGRRAVPAEIVVPCLPSEPELLRVALGGDVAILAPKSGERARMLGIAGENARAELVQAESERAGEEAALDELAQILALDGAPEVIDCFDVSNFQGSNVVASRVRFRRGHADRAGYRRFQVRGVEGQDDFASMKEVVGRSLRRGVEDDDLPDLVVIDGGAQQLAKALEARDEASAWEVAMVGLAKARSAGGARAKATDERLFVPGALEPIPLPRHSAARHLLERIRDEAHRFAITYHRKERGRIASRLDSIAGVGPERRKALLRAFGSVAGVKSASLEQIAAVPGIGPELAATIERSLREAS